MLDLRQIQYFICLYEERNVTRAAGRLNVVQPALSAQIGRLQKQLGLTLFERTNHGMIPTPAAEAMYGIYLPILLRLRHAHQQVLELSGKVLGKFAVGIIPSVTHSILADVLRNFSAEYPDVELRIDEAYSGTLIDWVITGDIDFAIVNSTRRKPGTSMVPLIDEELVLVQRAMPEPTATRMTFKKLAGFSLVLPSRRHGLRNIIEDAADEAGIRITPQIEIDALSPTLRLISESTLSAVLPDIVAHKSATEFPLHICRIVHPTLKRQLACVHRTDRPLAPIMSTFIHKLKQELHDGTIRRRISR